MNAAPPHQPVELHLNSYDQDDLPFDFDPTPQTIEESTSNTEIEDSATDGTTAEDVDTASPLFDDAVVPTGYDRDDNLPSFKLYSEEDLQTLGNSCATMKEEEELNRARRLLVQLRTSGPDRKLITLPADWERNLDALAYTMPNFEEVIDIVRSALMIQAANTRIVQFDPLLLVSRPGAGKTLFVERLAQALQLPMSVHRMQDAQSASGLSGSEAHWSNAKPGLVMQNLVNGQHGNFLLFIDELDKANNGSNGYNPTSPLITLLEPYTAQSFTDLCFPQLRLNASHVCYISAVNNVHLLSEPILSRFRIVHVPLPTPQQAVQIAQTLIAALQRDLLGERLHIQFSESALNRLSTESPRRMRLLVKEAIGRALCAQRTVVQAEDIAIGEAPRRSIGFM
ncbi:AAA family ATPase [Noviherbaspirillum malthae]|uniref:AAA family ATPase n=1 Tax=Noviherbaspirillum malthae TaxID=1260987 RepID=UPI00188FF707|nr:AAA family ATPase [Noviherbaspirillum malthae]